MFSSPHSALTLLVVVVVGRRPSGRHLLDVPPALLGGLQRPQLVLLLVEPAGREASVVLGRTGGAGGRDGCRPEHSQ